jgi:hypothetical protein
MFAEKRFVLGQTAFSLGTIDGFHNIAGEQPASLDWNQRGLEGQHYSSKPSVSCSAARSRTFSTHFL